MSIIFRPNKLKVVYVNSPNMSLKRQMKVAEKTEKEFFEAYKNIPLMVLFNTV